MGPVVFFFHIFLCGILGFSRFLCFLFLGNLIVSVRGHSEVSQNTLDVSGGGVLSKSDE